MKSSFSWPGRPPAEMISRNVNRLLTSILGGTPKRGAFCTSILGGTPKRGAFFTSILGGTPKRGAFFGRQGRGVSNTPSKRSRMGTRVAKGSQTSDSLSPTGPFDGAYAIRPYDGTSKEGAFCTSILDGTPKGGAFFGRQSRGVSNTPSKRSRIGTRVAKGSQASDSLSPTGPFDGAYAIRPNDGTPKRDAFASSFFDCCF